MTAQFVTTRRVEFCHTDMAGIMHFSNFYRFMEQAEHEFFRSLGLCIMEPQEDGSTIGWPRVSASCRFESPANHEDDVEIRVWVTRKGVKSLTFKMEFFHDGRRLAQGQLKTVCCRVRHGHPLESIEIPAAYSDLIHEAEPQP
ncbi:MAG: thioesterase family protein [Planctomycetota bacterium]|nr:thioesterase family protein [Planctomycetota bacterium]